MRWTVVGPSGRPFVNGACMIALSVSMIVAGPKSTPLWNLPVAVIVLRGFGLFDLWYGIGASLPLPLGLLSLSRRPVYLR